jgi:orotate phosphoribosyltransferase
LQTGLPASFIRDSEKNHGLGGMIDGYIPEANDVAAVVDDVFTTGSSLRETIEIILSTQAEKSSCHVVVKRGEGELQVPLFYIFDVNDLSIQD